MTEKELEHMIGNVAAFYNERELEAFRLASWALIHGKPLAMLCSMGKCDPQADATEACPACSGTKALEAFPEVKP